MSKMFLQARSTLLKSIGSCRYMSALCHAEFQDGVKRITFTAPKTRNALSLEMINQLNSEILKDKSNPALRCIVLKAEGPAFSAGHNLKEMTYKEGRAYHEEIFKKCNSLMFTIVKSPVPIIAQVDGIAAAAGCQLVSICDIAIATSTSKFSVPGASVGLFCSTPGIPLARSVPRKVAAYMLFTGKPITASEALNSGLISKMVSSKEDLEKEIESTCQAIISKPRGVIALGKRFYYQQLEMGLTEALEEGGQVMVDNLQLKDCQEGIRAFIQKDHPKWSHTEDAYDK